ncbi:hypothetical protein [Streptacidiphilus anmyonensis]|uniref:hypothetical protein n=1 Tax=Streptacidiphilus anmyonensis TaxID=405782 RepID=UPI00128B23D6|nr:hypothetical protein [Streptacidiphilus anmyonensis]
MANDGVPYVPVDDIPIEWRPAEASPRLKCWAAFPVDLLGTIGTSLGPDHEPLTIAIYETQRRIVLCSQRLKQAYLEWFQPSGPPGMHAHVHYQSPRDEPKRSTIESSMVVDYEAYLVFLDVALDLAAQAIGVLINDPKMNWKKLLKLAEQEPLPEWLSNDSAHAVRHLQRTALYARNNAVVHPKLLYSVVRTDNTGDVSYMRLPTVPPTEEMLTSLNNLVHRHFDLVEGARVGVNGFGPVIAMSLLDRASSKLSDDERKEVDGLRRTVGYTLPSVRDIAEAAETFLAGIVTFFGDRAAALARGRRD